MSDFKTEMLYACQQADLHKNGLLTIQQLQQAFKEVSLGEDMSIGEIMEMVNEAKCMNEEQLIDYKILIKSMFADEEENEEDASNES